MNISRVNSVKFKNFDEAADSILKMIAGILDINTLFIAKNDQKVNEIIKVVNKDETLLRAGEKLPFEDTYCKVSVDHGNEPIMISDITQHEKTKDLGVTQNLGSGSFIGIPIYFGDGKNYGTICGLDTEPFQLSEEHLELLETMSSLLSYVLELDGAQKQIDNLSVPIVPITKGVAVLPIIGSINVIRVERIIELTLSRSQELDLDHLVIDLSGIIEVDELMIGSLLKIVNLLKLLGVHAVLTGIRPETAMQANQSSVDFTKFDVETNLERALTKLGFHLEKK
ncbi:STAS domain-containing protein [Jeotgalibacillus salarius]|uniref:STAS domain-containing protein n=1 Tax=Jeotgalibacillus salarius TaxID=546023 RepID=A0A4Y8LFY0_9BACL|nr:STAS domain-containing protein [Jeotgalibacillus salarius]TFE00487.1 STAS domain-containing protein [Jeotgalibacillus salarius]